MDIKNLDFKNDKTLKNFMKNYFFERVNNSQLLTLVDWDTFNMLLEDQDNLVITLNDQNESHSFMAFVLNILNPDLLVELEKGTLKYTLKITDTHFEFYLEIPFISQDPDNA